MADVSQYTQQIRKAVYGRDVREAIAAGIEAVDENAKQSGEVASDALDEALYGNTQANGNIIIVDDAAENTCLVTAEKTDMRKPGNVMVGNIIIEQHDIVRVSKNLNTGDSSAEYTIDGEGAIDFTITVTFSGITAPGKYILSYKYKGYLPYSRYIYQKSRYDPSSKTWNMNQTSIVSGGGAIGNVDVYTDGLVEDEVYLGNDYGSFTYRFHGREIHTNETVQVSEIMLRPIEIEDSTYVASDSTVFKIENSENVDPIEISLNPGINILYCGSGALTATYKGFLYSKNADYKALKKQHSGDMNLLNEAVGKLVHSGTGNGAVIIGASSKNTASGSYSVSEGYSTTASGDDSHAEGSGSTANGRASHAEGSSTTATGANSHSEGGYCIAKGPYSHAEGLRTKAVGGSQHVFGMYNIEDDESIPSSTNYYRAKYIEIVGNGDSSKRSNARTLDWSGNEELAGNLTLGKGTVDEVTITAAQLKALLAMLT